MDLTNRPKTKPSYLSMSSENYTILDLTTRPKTKPSYLSPPPLPGIHQGLPKIPPKRLSKFPLPPSKRLLEHPPPPGICPPPPGICPPPSRPGICPARPGICPPSPGIFPPEHCLMIREMQRQFQLQSQHAPKQHQKVCSSSNNSTTTTTSTAINLTNASESMKNLKNNLIDIFPSITIFEDEEDVKFLSRDNFKNHSAQAYPFIQFKFDNSDYISYYGLESSSDTEKKNEERDRLYRILKATKLLDERTGNENVSWTKLDDVFKKLPVSFRKKKITTKSGAAIKMNREKHREEHADTRLGYRFDNMFAVKRFFTFGERMVNSGEVHIIQTCEVPILYNELKMEHYRNKRKISQSTTTTNVYNEKFDALFDPTDQKYYNTYVLNPHTVYMVPSNTIYILITMQKTLFSLDRVDNNKFQKMRTENWRWKVLDIYPPQAHKQLQIEIPSSVNPVVCKNVKRKKLLDHEKKWVYNDVLNPPQIFTQPRQIIVEGEDQEIQFNTEPTYFYFEPNNQFYYQQQEQQNVLMSGIENNDDILINPPVICCYSSTPPPQQQQEEQNLVMSGIENNDEILINPPVIGCSSTPPPPQQQQEEQNVVMSGIEKIDEMLISPLVISCSSTPPPPQQQEQQNVVMSNCKNDDEMLINPLVISCSSTPPPPQEQQNVVMSNCKNDDEMLINPLVISCSSTPPPPPQQQQEQQNVVMSNCENDDEMLINPLVICCSPPPQQQQDVVMSNNENDGEILTTPPSTPLKESSSLSDETTKFSTPPPQSDKNGLMFDFDSIDYSSPLPEEQKEQFNETLLELSKLADDNISLNPLSCDDNNHSENNPIPTISFKDMSFTEPSENFITECNKLLEDLNNFAKECLEL